MSAEDSIRKAAIEVRDCKVVIAQLGGIDMNGKTLEEANKLIGDYAVAEAKLEAAEGALRDAKWTYVRGACAGASMHGAASGSVGDAISQTDAGMASMTTPRHSRRRRPMHGP